MRRRPTPLRGFATLSLSSGFVLSLAAWSWVTLVSHANPDAPTRVLSVLPALAAAWVGFGFCAASSGLPSLRSVLLLGVLLRLPGLFALPLLGNDQHRYVWDGYLVAHGHNPYATAPIDWFPCADLPADISWTLTQINYPHLPTIYGPAAQLLFAANALIGDGSWLFWKVGIVAADCGIALMLGSMAGAKAALLWLWCPLAIFEGVYHGHFESLAIAPAIAALMLPRVPAAVRGLFAATAVALRPFALLTLPFVLTGPHRTRHEWVGTALGLLGGLLALYLPFGGLMAAGSSGVFFSDWEFNSSIFAVISLAAGPDLARILVAAMLSAFCGALWLRWRMAEHAALDGAVRALTFAFAALLWLSPVANPWYALWVVPFLAMQPGGPTGVLIWALVACLPLSYLTGQNLGGPDGHLHPAWVRPVEYGIPLVALFAAILWQRWQQLRLRRGVSKRNCD